MENKPIQPDNKFGFLDNEFSRLDKNMMTSAGLRNLEAQFGQQTKLVLDIMIFMGTKYRNNLFGMLTFTLDELAKGISSDKGNLSRKFELPKGTKNYPEIEGTKLVSVLDYTLWMMKTRSWNYSEPVYDKVNNGIEKVEIKDVKLLENVTFNFNRKSGEVKFYEVRLNNNLPAILSSQFWGFNHIEYFKLGRTKNNKSLHVQSLHLNMSAKKQLAQYKNQTAPILITTVDDLCNAALINMEQRPADRKKVVKRLLEKLKANTSLNFNYRFFSKAQYKEDYWVELTFDNAMLNDNNEVTFLFIVHQHCLKFFNSRYKDVKIDGETSPFQRWLTNENVDLQEKINIIKVAYKNVFKNSALPSDNECAKYVLEGAGQHTYIIQE